MLQVPDDASGSDALLILACKLFLDRISAFGAAVAGWAVSSADTVHPANIEEARLHADAVFHEASTIGRAIVATPV